MGSRLQKFWLRISDGIAVQDLWAQLHGEARASYRLYSKDIELKRPENQKRSQRVRVVGTGLFWAMILKLSPSRRILFLIAIFLSLFPALQFHYEKADLELPNFSFFGVALLVILIALELADRVTMKRDLEIAKEIQTWLMPATPPTAPGIDIGFATRPANTVAGDYYDAFSRTASDGVPPLILAVADVAGKSVPAALLMATLQASLRTLADVCKSPLELVERWNLYCCKQNVTGQRFTTAFLAELDPVSRQMTYVNAGHNWPVLRRASGQLERLETGGVPLGLLKNARYECGRVALREGDVLLVFTDGLVEAENSREEEYGEERMLATLNATWQAPAKDVVRALVNSADQFVNNAPQHDDITCLVVKAVR